MTLSARVDDLPGVVARGPRAGRGTSACPRRPGSTGPGSRAWRPPAGSRRRRARAPGASSGPRAGSEAARSSRVGAPRACRSGPWRHRSPRPAAGPRRRRRPARSGRSRGSTRRAGPPARASRRCEGRRCRSRMGSAFCPPRSRARTRRPPAIERPPRDPASGVGSRSHGPALGHRSRPRASSSFERRRCAGRPTA